MRADRLPGRPLTPRLAGVVRSTLRSRFTAFLLSLGALLWLTACLGGESGGGRVAGGTGSEAGDAYGMVRSVGGEHPAACARVSLYESADSTYTHPRAYADTTTDSSGRYHFRILKTGRYDLEIRSPQGDGIRFRGGILLTAPGEINLGDDVLTEPAKLRDRLPALPVSATTIWLGGTPYSTAVDSLGNFTFPILPKGDYPIFSERNVGGTLIRVDLGVVHLMPGDSLAPPDTIAIPPADTGKPVIIPPQDTVSLSDTLMPGQFMIEDFNDDDAVSNYGRLTGKGRWIPFSSGLTSMFPFSSATFASSQSALGAYRGKSLNVEYVVDPSASEPAKSIVELSMSPLSPNLKTADTLVFYAKGTGVLVAQVEFEFLSRVLEGTGKIALTMDWKQYRIPIKVKTVGSPSITNAIRFTGMLGTFFGLDNIVLTGTTFKAGDAR